MGFTPAELAEIARADAEIEANFCITNEEIAFGHALDRASALDNMDSRKRKAAESQRRWYEANKEKVAESKRRYREANKEKVAESKRAILELRRSLGLSQKQFGAILGVSQVTVSNWERIKAPENWQAICAAYALGGGVIHSGICKNHQP